MEAPANELFVPAAAWTAPYRCHDNHSNAKGTPHNAATNSKSPTPIKDFSGAIRRTAWHRSLQSFCRVFLLRGHQTVGIIAHDAVDAGLDKQAHVRGMVHRPAHYLQILFPRFG